MNTRNLFLVSIALFAASALLLSDGQSERKSSDNVAALSLRCTPHKISCRQGEVAALRIRMTNESLSDIIISDEPIKSCECELVESAKGIIAPGKSKLIKVNVNTSSLSGIVERSIVVRYSDVQRRECIAFAKYSLEIEPEFSVEPRSLSLTSSEPTGTIRIIDGFANDIRFRNVISMDPRVNCHVSFDGREVWVSRGVDGLTESSMNGRPIIVLRTTSALIGELSLKVDLSK